MTSSKFRRLNTLEGDSKHLLCSQSFYAVKAPDERSLATLTVAANSSVVLYFLCLSAGRMASYRPTVRLLEFEDTPIPPVADLSLESVAAFTDQEIDETAFQLYGLNEVERTLIGDFVSTTLPDFRSPLGPEDVNQSRSQQT